eukprot:g8342.t1
MEWHDAREVEASDEQYFDLDLDDDESPKARLAVVEAEAEEDSAMGVAGDDFGSPNRLPPMSPATEKFLDWLDEWAAAEDEARKIVDRGWDLSLLEEDEEVEEGTSKSKKSVLSAEKAGQSSSWLISQSRFVSQTNSIASMDVSFDSHASTADAVEAVIREAKDELIEKIELVAQDELEQIAENVRTIEYYLKDNEENALSIEYTVGELKPELRATKEKVDAVKQQVDDVRQQLDEVKESQQEMASMMRQILFTQQEMASTMRQMRQTQLTVFHGV